LREVKPCEGATVSLRNASL